MQAYTIYSNEWNEVKWRIEKAMKKRRNKKTISISTHQISWNFLFTFFSEFPKITSKIYYAGINDIFLPLTRRSEKKTTANEKEKDWLLRHNFCTNLQMLESALSSSSPSELSLSKTKLTWNHWKRNNFRKQTNEWVLKWMNLLALRRSEWKKRDRE